MSDTLTDRLATSVKTRAPFVMKYVPYGALSEVKHARATCPQAIDLFLTLSRISPYQVMPYLSRRATENKSVLGHGHAAEERKRAFDALWQYLFEK
jgi:proline dehydrogenase